jgi:hypothetical protein
MPEIEAPAITAPVAPVSELVERSARQIASAVWERGKMSKAALFSYSADEWLAHAVEMQWVTVDGSQIKRGPINPQPADAALSYREARMRWGPSWTR